jgi:hypothetical protein
MFATRARQAGRVQLEQANMRLALIMAKMAKGGMLRTALKQSKQLSKNLAVKSEKRSSEELSFLRRKM